MRAGRARVNGEVMNDSHAVNGDVHVCLFWALKIYFIPAVNVKRMASGKIMEVKATLNMETYLLLSSI